MRRHSAFTIVELVVAMAVIAILAAVGTVSYEGYMRHARTATATGVLSEIGVALETYRTLSAVGAYPTDTVNAAGQANSGAPSYDALAADIATLAQAAFPSYASVFASWTYWPGAPAAVQGPCCTGLDVSLAVGPDGSVSGTFGGVPVQGRVSTGIGGETLILDAGGAVFVTGSYACWGGCVFSGTVAGRTVLFDFSGDPAQGGTVVAQSGKFQSHGAWVSSVARWTNQNVPPGNLRGQIVSGAARSPWLSGSPDQPPAPVSYTVTATASSGDGHVLCLDGIAGVSDLGVGGSPASPGVSCR